VYGRFVLLTPKKLERAEHWLARYEAGGIFFARLLPVVRYLISISAGIVRMKFGLFSLMTITGSTIWCYILAYLGDKAYRVDPELLTEPEALVRFNPRSVDLDTDSGSNLCGSLHLVDAPLQTAAKELKRQLMC
jgi:hypothetical protein